MIIIKTNYGFKVYILDDEWVVEYPDLKVVGTGLTFDEAFKVALENKDNYLKYLRENHFPIPKNEFKEFKADIIELDMYINTEIEHDFIKEFEEEINFLYNEFAYENDENLHSSGKKLKQKLLNMKH